MEAHPSEAPLSLSAIGRIESARERFEAEWRAGRRPRIEDYLPSQPGPERARLLRELVKVEVAYRRKLEGRADQEDYRGRFPAEGETLDAAFAVESEGFWTDATQMHVRASDGEAVPEIPGYEILAELGRGGMGIVFKARHVRLDRVVALKTLRPTLIREDTRVSLEAEARLVARFDHPHLVRVFDSGEHQGRPWFALELVEGGTLATALRDGPWRPADAARLVAQLADAVEYAHQAGVIHRDLKPANVLLTADGTPKITDFGLGRMLEDDARGVPAGEVVGTPVYAPPEQAAGRFGESGKASDVFGLGAILYELLTGRPPWSGASLREVLDRASRGEVVPPRRTNPAVPAALERICLKALARAPGDRHASAAELARELRRWLIRPRRAFLAAAGALGLAAIAGLGWWAVRRPTPAAALEPLSGELIVSVWSVDRVSKRGLRVDQPGALPARFNEGIEVEARLNQPAYAYLVLLPSQGAVVPLYPWNRDEITTTRITPVADETPRRTVRSPEAQDAEWPLDDKDGLETVLLLARRTPLPREVDLGELIGSPPPARLRDELEWATRGGDEGQEVNYLDLGAHRGIQQVARRIDDPLLQILGRLREHFEVIRAVRFAHKGK